MASIRNVEDRILDAARACVEAFGVRRTTLTDVARRAGVSRPTVYRRWPDATALVADLLTRELRRILADQGEGPGGPAGEDVRARLVRHAAGVARALLAHPLFVRIVDTEPELLATYTFQRLGTSHRAALELVEPVVAEGQRDGSVRAGDPAVLARLVLVTVQGTVTSRRLFADVTDESGLVDELAALLDGYLRPPNRESP
ncbi:TetR/AcrR family transcriptional regulator [Nocardiopsis sp. HUAS JQ3]|uniref:TetR/AcrR family transcriptional regulator n=1 Tax=Nocardiopsis sp. HUAS JQ3 TaxID=3061629 RepID=UPI0023A91A90|nr:TetR/AcrR family transcriptional regulator [Nocardiopsis sp. HUAS JQ3]WDZ91997.1 helix-turn-helix domain containing protein [Nocardiopsis sp. HUAS JQ3]